MAAITSRTPTTHLHRQINSKSSPSDQKLITIVKLPVAHSERRRSLAVLASLHRDNGDESPNAYGSKNKNNSIEFQKLLEDSPNEFNSKDINSLPRPLSSTHLSVSDRSRLRVAYQGVGGAYSESAAEKAYPNCEAVPCEQFETAFDAVERWLVDRAVLPIENSLGGSIHRNYDLLLRHRLHIVGEVKLAIRHCLLANHGVKVEDLKRVLSHPQALAQCENTLTRLGMVREAVDDTAGAAKFVAFQKLKDTGAVASSTAASIYDMDILAQDIQIESRPLQKQALGALDDSNNGFPKCFPYLFYVDFEASMAEQNAQNALGHLKEMATFLRVLGSYPADISIA
ncbi:arogenate dehydratase/prephenate dehydratase 2, chloroplastic-like isoform X2 [Camellia sinensis]|uniref:arogenate dehydratase/prephenate dehydratase 2, chloroplastic-like isoform X2 n=1 Tax=Camellia sinensis TaxID=4442 RepID=UPI001036ACFE|nr:arogenate dehydratase/prephenate dehydratase 2, chloroplastic-like isoform X2 [Camellia sinensis]